ncbi:MULTISPECIES: phosphate ABC transporter substrate-binding protein [unclassified Xanthomonas]|uniref:phosphate ABC transporter substrate-binding protein n=1 Tax=unclassified Xanthomonas TaxID=2643310 RepID=UPI00160B7CEB|nr:MULTISPECIES: phosphate ABC transporter substrate-binding protein [unclassified Xanthomonas]MBB4133064.1 ABC-type phosphate transport system substrate-binding protein [Xanthomonas sp. 3075]MBB5863497.1 ABC-type phosphate transport system substrate-binding protein [Xanthomonas sp. 3058]
MKNIYPLLAVLLLSAPMHAIAGAVVVAKDSPVAVSNAEEAKKVFLGRQTSSGGKAITLLYQKDAATRAEFETKVLGKTGADLTGYWSKLIFSGKATAPTEVASDAEVKSKLKSNPGAVGYVSDKAIDDSVKVLLKY